MTLRSTIDRSIKRSNQTTVLVGVVFILVGVIGFVGLDPLVRMPASVLNIIGTSRYLIAQLSGPQVMTSEDIGQLTAAQLPRYNVQITADRVHNLNGESFEYFENSGGIVNYYAILKFEKGDMLLRSVGIANEQQLVYTGTLRVPFEKVARDMQKDFTADYEAEDADLYPFVMDTTDKPIYWILPAIVEGVLVLIGIALLREFFRFRDPMQHPIMQGLARYGDVETVIGQIDDELNGQTTQVHSLQFTRNWLIHKSGNDMAFVKFQDIMWLYKQADKSTAEKTYYMYLQDRNGFQIAVSEMHDSDPIDQMFRAVADRAPWAITAYSKETETSWKQDRQAIVRSVDDRREQMISRL